MMSLFPHVLDVSALDPGHGGAQGSNLSRNHEPAPLLHNRTPPGIAARNKALQPGPGWQTRRRQP